MKVRLLIALWAMSLLLAGCEGDLDERAPGGEHAEHGTPRQSAATSEKASGASPSARRAEATRSQPDEPGASQSAAADKHAGHAGHAAAVAAPSAQEHAADGHDPQRAAPEGYSSIPLARARAGGLGLTTAPVEYGDFTRSLRTIGVVVLDETRTSRVHAKIRGWIESISADFVGKRVQRGVPLVTIYSQEVYAAELEFLSILEQPPLGAGLSNELATAERLSRDRLVAAARKRLSLWDVPAAEIARLERTRKPRRTFTLTAPRAGIVVAKQALAGAFVDPSVELYLISDIRKLWVLADVYDTDVPFVKLGDSARLSIEGAGPKSIPAKVVFVPPTIDEATRTLKVRFEVENPDGRLRPGAFATVEMDLALGHGLSIPEDAVIHAGPRAIVFVVRGDHVEPREVQLGPNVAGRYRIEKGLRADERVATGAQFLLDSESRLRASSASGAGHAGH